MIPTAERESTLGARQAERLPYQVIEDRPEYQESYGLLWGTAENRSDKYGVTLDEDGASVVIPTGPGVKHVDVCIYSDDGEEPLERWRLTRDKDDSSKFGGYIPEMKPGTVYGIRVEGEPKDDSLRPFDYHKLLVDPYAKAFIGGINAVDENGKIRPELTDGVYDGWGRYIGPVGKDSGPYVPKCVVVDESYDWGHDQRPEISDGHRVIYEAHVKGMTMLHPDIPEEIRGTYAAMAHPAVIAHLKSIGVTSVELLPVQQISPEPFVQKNGFTNYWGYNTIGFFAPHNGYAGQQDNSGSQVREFKDMVKALHEAGMEVILDVVYNHTAESGHSGPNLMFKGLGLAPDAYLITGKRDYANQSGTGDATNGTNPFIQEMFLNSLRFWVEEMHVDGFRFDLAPVLARRRDGSIDIPNSLIQRITDDPVLKKVRLIAEPWDCSFPDGQLQQRFPEGWYEWDDKKSRDPFREYWLQQSTVAKFADAFSGGTWRGRSRPIGFITAHDGFTLGDLVSYDGKHNEANREHNNDGNPNNMSYNHGHEGPTNNSIIIQNRLRSARNLALSLLIAHGTTPMISQGDEIGRTQGGNNNAYCQDNEIAWSNWNLGPEQSSMLDFFRGVATLRRQYPEVFAQAEPVNGKSVAGEWTPKDIAWFNTNGQHGPAWEHDKAMTVLMAGVARGAGRAAIKRFALVVNSSENDIQVTLPTVEGSTYHRVVNTEDGVFHIKDLPQIVGDGLSVRGRSAHLLQILTEAT